jgi:hypothetical protein
LDIIWCLFWDVKQYRAGFWVRENTEKERTDGKGVTDLCVCECVRNLVGWFIVPARKRHERWDPFPASLSAY